jgi:hypothetical protein
LLFVAGTAFDVSAGLLAGTGEPCARRYSPGCLQSVFSNELLEGAEDDLLAQRVLYPEDEVERSLTRRPTVDRAASVPPGIAFLMSAALPGAGQLAQGRRRAFLYLGVELFSWIAHFSWKDAGNKKEGEYEAYARRHWDFDKWRELASGDSLECLDAIPTGVDPADAESTLVRFIREGNLQHFYEDIGKLEAYRGGWGDYDCANPDEMSPQRKNYRNMRADSNDYLEDARLAKTLAFLNRIVSAVDAFRVSKGARLALSRTTSLQLAVGGSPYKPSARLEIRRQW